MTDTVEIQNCRSCGSSNLTSIISLGNQYVINFITSKEDQEKVPKVPLDLVLCENCKLLQLRHNAPPESLWSDQYWYKSSINRMIREDLKDIVDKSRKMVLLLSRDVVVDVGCNDGTLLDNYKENSEILRVGFEPSKNVAREAQERGHRVITGFFDAKKYVEQFGEKKAKIITAISMFYDLEDPNEFLEDIAKILAKDGLFVIQQNYLVTMLQNNALDNICHEHREYYSLLSLIHLLDRHNFEIFKVEQNGINGGSIRTYIKFKDNETLTPSEADKLYLQELINNEKELGLDTKTPYFEFASRIDIIKTNLVAFLNREKSLGKKICGLGASTRGTVLLQYFGIGPELLDCIFDMNPDKEGKKTIGTLIPITHPKNIGNYNPDYQLVLIWHIFKGIGNDEKEFVNRGGKFILPLPSPQIIDHLN